MVFTSFMCVSIARKLRSEMFGLTYTSVTLTFSFQLLLLTVHVHAWPSGMVSPFVGRGFLSTLLDSNNCR